VVNRLKQIYLEKNKNKIELEKVNNLQSAERPLSKAGKHASGVVIKGIDNVKIRLSKCCNPVPGDAIVGFITRGRGVSIHRADCTNIHDLNDTEDERFIDVEWDEGEEITFTSELQIKALDRPRLLQDLTRLYTDAKLNATSLNLRINKEKIAIIEIAFEINETKQLEELIKKFKKLDGVIEVFRTKK
jgi:GTP pyrophosphokinase